MLTRRGQASNPGLFGTTVLAAASNDGVSAYQSGISSGVVDLTGLSITFIVSVRPVVVSVSLPWVAATVAGTTAAAYITDETGAAKAGMARTIAVANGITGIVGEEWITTPGTYTRKVQFHRFGGTGLVSNNLSGSALTVSRISAVEQ